MNTLRLPVRGEGYSSHNGNVNRSEYEGYVPLCSEKNTDTIIVVSESSRSSYSGANGWSRCSYGQPVLAEKILLLEEEKNEVVYHSNGDNYPSYGATETYQKNKLITEQCFFESYSSEQFWGSHEKYLMWHGATKNILCERVFGTLYTYSEETQVSKILLESGSWDTNNGRLPGYSASALWQVFMPENYKACGLETWLEAIALAEQKNFSSFLRMKVLKEEKKAAYFSTIYRYYHEHDKEMWALFCLGDNDPEKTKKVINQLPKDRKLKEIFIAGLEKHGYKNFFALLRARKSLKKIAAMPSSFIKKAARIIVANFVALKGYRIAA
jgi:hypothetical protein